MSEIDYKFRAEFYQNEVESLQQRLLDTQVKCIEAQRLAIERGWALIEANNKLLEKK